MKTLNEHLKKKEFKNVYLICGKEAYLRKQYRDRFRAAVLDPEDTMNYSYFEGKHIDVKAVASVADTMPFFAEHRLIVVENSGFFASTQDYLADYIKKIPETTCLIFVEQEVDKRNKVYKAVNTAGYVATLEVPGDKQLMMWLAGMVKKEQKQIQESTMKHFMDVQSRNMNGMRLELEKLICYVGDRNVITWEDVDAVACIFTEDKVFSMIEAVAGKRQQQAMTYYNDLVALKVAPMLILNLMTKQFNTLYAVKGLLLKGFPTEAIMDRMKMREYPAKKNASLARQFSIEVLRGAVEECIDMEEKIKTGNISDRIAVELLIARYSRSA